MADNKRDTMLANFALSGGLEVSAAMGELLAERDRLRAVVRDIGMALGIDWWVERESSVIDGVQRLRAERDRLRAVADVARRLLRTNTTTDGEVSLVAEVDHWAVVALDDALHQLDGSGDMGGGDEHLNNPKRPPSLSDEER